MTEMELRPWREEDICALPALAGDWEVAKNLRDVFPHPYGEKDAVNYIRSVQAATPQEALMYAIRLMAGWPVPSAFFGKRMYTKKARSWVIGWESLIGARAL